jgi:hypothetical protein
MIVFLHRCYYYVFRAFTLEFLTPAEPVTDELEPDL